ncbi:hypothetical protein BGW80DRAFT_1440235 [Lactifluus volemus]|nr:hypothetical protein BGW80DRAFT_1440235 [Lactifluus volemus]
MSNLETKSLNRQAKKAQKDEDQGNNDGAWIYASNTSRKKSESLNLLRLASRIETAVTMRQISLVMDKFESQFSDSDVQTSYMEDAMDQVDSLMRQMAEGANVELQQDLADKEVPSLAPPERSAMIGEEDSTLADRLRALRPAT